MNRPTKGVAWYLLIAFGMAWIVWEIAIRLGVPATSWRFQIFGLVGGFAPAVAAFVVRKWITREGFADAGLGLRPRNWPYYLFAWLLPLGVVGVIVLEAMALGVTQPDFTLTRAATSDLAGRSIGGLESLGLLIVPQLLVTALVMTPLLWGEEFGWRGYLQRRLLADRPLAAAVVTGVIWGVWHWPLTLRGYDFPGHPVTGSLLLVAFAVLMSIILGWLRERSGSIWVPSLGHAATNVVGALAMLWLAGGDLTVVSYAGALAFPPLAAVCAWIVFTGRLRPRPAEGEAAAA